MKYHNLIGIGLVILAIFGGIVWSQVREPNKPATISTQSQVLVFNKSQYSLESPASIWVVVNKSLPLNPEDFAPDDLVTPQVALRLSPSEMQLRKQAATALEALFRAAKKDVFSLMLASGYRSHSQQTVIYNSEVRAFGQAIADTESARPGHSEHQTGLAADIEPQNRQCEIQACFGELPEGKWLADHAHEYGFIIRYQQEKQAITGYKYEPWHIRYVGRELASEINMTGHTLEEFFGLPAAPEYK